jgi:PST family polysaccharide transporter
VFWSQIGIASAVALLLAAAAPLLAGFFRRPDLVPLLRVMCFNLPLGAAASAPLALLTRTLRFRRIAAVETVSLAVGGGVGVGLALAGWGVWSLAGQALAASAASALLLVPLSGLAPLSPKARPSRAHLRDLLRFSAPLTAYQWLNFLSRNLDDILIGRFLGAGALGYYQLAYRVMMYPLQKVSDVVGRVTFPALASMQDDAARMRQAYLRTVRYIALITLPMMAVVILAAPELIRVLFGPSWEPVAPLIQVLSLAGMAGSIGTTVGTLFLARGRSGLMLRWELLASACYAASIALGLRWGLMGVAIAYTTMSLLLWPLSHLVANRLIALPMRQFFAALLPQAGLALVLASALAALKLAWQPSALPEQAAFLGVCALASAGTLLAAARLGRPAAAGEAAALLREAMGQRGSR